jgi:rRNA maturation protein Nop10
MPYWTCENCSARLYSASETLRWDECPVCEGTITRLPEPARVASLPEREDGHPDGRSSGAD